eukprot:TRINITY_DN113_c0_g2_i1.p1 TRINITY_DN113_c0_g2~~TRINITY_DN113_c0_g2_i1.p1  ORF type:complete len:624 (+),score=103.35 TRINITY_DN113_c0_g2_i1:71-1942(+)
MLTSAHLRNLPNKAQQALQIDPRVIHKCRESINAFSLTKTLQSLPSLIWEWCLQPYTVTPNTSYYSCLAARLIMAQYVFNHSTKTCIPKMLHPIGFGKLFDITQFCTQEAIAIEQPILCLCLFLYSINKFPILSLTYILWFLTMVYQSINGNGTIFHAYQVVALTLLMQWAGHIFLFVRNRWFKPKNEKPGMYGDKITEDAFIFRLSSLALCGIYVTSAISKHRMSKGTWFTHAEYFITNLVSVNEREYYNLGDKSTDFMSIIFPQILMMYPLLTRWFFGSAFIFELIAPLFLYNRFWMMVGGVVTWMMHEGIAVTMRLTFLSHQRVLLAYLIDPVYWIQRLYFFLLDYYQCRMTLRKNSSGDDLKEPSSSNTTSTTTTVTSITVMPSFNRRDHQGYNFKDFLRLLWRFPWKSMVALIIINLYMKETFPFSNFPMYGAPPVRGDYFFISDKYDNPIFTAENFRMTGAQMKRSFFYSCKKYLNTNRPMEFRTNRTVLEYCGNRTLEFFSDIVKPERRDHVERLKPWKLNWVYIELERKTLTVTKNVTVIASLGIDEEYLAKHPENNTTSPSSQQLTESSSSSAKTQKKGKLKQTTTLDVQSQNVGAKINMTSSEPKTKPKHTKE